MKRTNLFAVATLALGLFACDCNSDRASETNTTSAQPTTASQPVEHPAGGTTAAPTAPVDTSTSVNADLKDAGHAGMTTTTGGDMDMNAKDAGHRAGTNLDKKGKTVAPGHITTPPDHGRATGAPNSDGSHDVGSGNTPNPEPAI